MRIANAKNTILLNYFFNYHPIPTKFIWNSFRDLGGIIRNFCNNNGSLTFHATKFQSNNKIN